MRLETAGCTEQLPADNPVERVEDASVTNGGPGDDAKTGAGDSTDPPARGDDHRPHWPW